jgi:hypothetical protein
MTTFMRETSRSDEPSRSSERRFVSFSLVVIWFLVLLFLLSTSVFCLFCFCFSQVPDPARSFFLCWHLTSVSLIGFASRHTHGQCRRRSHRRSRSGGLEVRRL